MTDELIKRLRRWANFGYGVNASKCMIEACDALEESNTVMSKANAALEAANARIAELEAAAKAEPVGEVVANDPVHGWHFQPYIGWQQLGAGRKLYTAPAATDNGGGRDAVTDAQVEAALAAFNAFPCPENGSVVRTWDTDQMRAALLAALAQPLEAQADARWQPIETAPKDGTPIVIACIDDDTVFDVCNGHFEVLLEDEDDGPWDIRDGEPWCSYVGRQAGTYFCCWLPGKEWERGWKVPDDFEYTHWMPLPAAPAALSQKAGE